MPPKAHVSSVDALRAFRTNLILYLSKARPTVDEVNSEVVRTKAWLERDQRLHWEHEVRKRGKELERAQGELFNSRISNDRGAGLFQQMAFRKAKAAYDAASDKLRTIKMWDREFENRVQPLVKELEKLHTILSHDLPMAIAYLGQATGTLDAYADIALAPDSTNATAPAMPASAADAPADAGAATGETAAAQRGPAAASPESAGAATEEKP
jgi:hypothetical protein